MRWSLRRSPSGCASGVGTAERWWLWIRTASYRSVFLPELANGCDFVLAVVEFMVPCAAIMVDAFDLGL